MKNFFIGAFIGVGAIIGFGLPMILGWWLFFNGFTTIGGWVVHSQALWLLLVVIVVEYRGISRRKA